MNHCLDNPHLVKVSCYKISFHNFCRIPIKFCSYSSRILRSFVLPIRKVELDASRWRWFSEQKKQVTAEFVKSMSRILVIKSIHDFLPNWMIFFHLSPPGFIDLSVTINCIFGWSPDLPKTEDFWINHADINLKPQFLIKSGYYMAPSPSTAWNFY